MESYIFLATIKAAQSMFLNQSDLDEFTYQTDHHEPNLSFHFANELWRYFPWLNCDFDVKKTNVNKRPDIIFHRRGSNRYNLLVVEVKRRSNREVTNWICESDEQKIRSDWFSEPLKYPYGISIVLDETDSSFVFALLEPASPSTRKFSSQQLTRLDLQNTTLVELETQIINAKMRDPDADTGNFEQSLSKILSSWREIEN